MASGTGKKKRRKKKAKTILIEIAELLESRASTDLQYAQYLRMSNDELEAELGDYKKWKRTQGRKEGKG